MSLKKTVYPLLYGDSDIYAGFDAAEWDGSPHGWNDHSKMFNELCRGAELLVEIGSWLGRSALMLCDAAPEAEVVCVDTWLGAKEMWLTPGNDPERYNQLRLRHGYPNLYYAFLGNIVRAGKQHQVTPMPLPSNIALDFLKDKEVSPDLIYIDASHSYEDVAHDIKMSLELHPAVICGDDATTWPGVARAVDEEFGKRVEVNTEGFWYKIL